MEIAVAENKRWLRLSQPAAHRRDDQLKDSASNLGVVLIVGVFTGLPLIAAFVRWVLLLRILIMWK